MLFQIPTQQSPAILFPYTTLFRSCWNEMSYYNEYMDYVQDRTKTNIHGPHRSSSNKAFIEQYVQDNVTGIQLKNDKNRHYCPTCHTEYMKEPRKVDNQDGEKE